MAKRTQSTLLTLCTPRHTIYKKGAYNMKIWNATDVRKDWSRVVDLVSRDRPQFIKRTHDNMLLANEDFIFQLLDAYSFTAEIYKEADGSITLSLHEIDLVENASTQEDARNLLAASLLDYAAEYFDDFKLWSSAPNRKNHIPYVLKALLLATPEKIAEEILCQDGKS